MKFTILLIFTLSLISCSSQEDNQKARADHFVREEVLPVLRTLENNEVINISCRKAKEKSLAGSSAQMTKYTNNVGLLIAQKEIEVSSSFFDEKEDEYTKSATYKINADFALGRRSIAVGLVELNGSWCLAAVSEWPNV